MKKQNILSVATVAVTVLLSLVLAQPSIANSGSMDDAAMAIIANDTKSLEVSIERLDVNINTLIDQQYGLLHIAAMAGNSDAIESLLSAGADIDVLDAEHGWTALMHAAHLGHADIVEYLMERGADITVVGSDLSTAEVLARFSGVSQLFEGEANKRTHGQSFDTERLNEMLLRAAEVGDLNLAGHLIHHGADPNAMSPAGWNVLLYSAFRNDWSAVEFFLLRGTSSSSNQLAVSLTEAALLGASANPDFEATAVNFLENLERKFLLRYNSPRSVFARDRNIGYGDLARKLELNETIVNLFYKEPKYRPIKLEVLVKPEMTVDDWRRTQTYLRNLGLYRGNIDGVPGPLTRNGIFAYYQTQFEEIGASGAEFCRSSVEYFHLIKSEIERITAGQGLSESSGIEIREMLQSRNSLSQFRIYLWGPQRSSQIKIIETLPHLMRVDIEVSASGDISLIQSLSNFDIEDPFDARHGDSYSNARGDYYSCLFYFKDREIFYPKIIAFYNDIVSNREREIRINVAEKNILLGKDVFCGRGFRPEYTIEEGLTGYRVFFLVDKCGRRFYAANRAGTGSPPTGSNLYLWGSF